MEMQVPASGFAAQARAVPLLELFASKVGGRA